MRFETAKQVLDTAVSQKQPKTGIAFFGGEPLLHKDLIKQIVSYARGLSQNSGCKFYFKLTTNGLMLDEEFVRFCKGENIFTAISLDGVRQAHDLHRKDAHGNGTFERVESAASALLAHLPNSPVMLTLNPDTVRYYAESVRYLKKLGFVYIFCGLNYSAEWQSAHMRQLKGQYKKLAEFYYENTLAEVKFYLSPFENKIGSHINNRTYRQERCELGKNQLSVASDGALYPCLEFVDDPQYKIGDVFSGVDEGLVQQLFNQSKAESPDCMACAIRARCNHACACQNKRATGAVNRVSAALCRHEQILLPIADKLAKRLYRKRSGQFIQKHYNEFYPILSILEDR